MSALRLSHPTLGEIIVNQRKGSHKVSARWKKGVLTVNVPYGVSRRDIESIISQHAADFERIRPRPLYAIGSKIRIETGSAPTESGFTAIEIRLVPNTPGINDFTASYRQEGNNTIIFYIHIPMTADVTSPDVRRRIDNGIKLVARRIASNILITRGRQLAAELNLRVDKWEIAGGNNVLGTCYPRQRRIRLSHINVFLPPELRDYIICHELAHLTEPGHTPAFHALCNRYLNGREAELIRALRTYKWPVER